MFLMFGIVLFIIIISSVATLPGMWDRTVTIGSAGKTFSVTGWKVSRLWIQNPVFNIQ